MSLAKPLEGKVGIVTGVANHRSIAFGIAKAWHEAGASSSSTTRASVSRTASSSW